MNFYKVNGTMANQKNRVVHGKILSLKTERKSATIEIVE